MASSVALSSSSVSIVIHRLTNTKCCSCNSTVSVAVPLSSAPLTRRRRPISCQVALKPTNSAVDIDEEEAATAKIGARVRVKVPLKVYHVPRVPEIDLTGMEGQLKQYVALWKGKRISANLPYKVEFVTHVEGRGPVKFFAHLKPDEFDFLD